MCAISGVAPEEPVFAPKTGLQPWRLRTGSGKEIPKFPEIGLVRIFGKTLEVFMI